MPQTELISVVAPVYNEADGIAEFHRRVGAALADVTFELILVNDGSRDGSGVLMEQIAVADRRVRCLHLSRNFGHQAALTAGIDAAQGDAVVTIDADLQDPPEFIPDLLAHWRGGADVVHAVRHVRPGEPRMRLWAIRAFYRVFERISGLPDFPGNSGDFRLMNRTAADALRSLPEHNRFIRGLVSWVGFRQISVEYEREARFAGRSKYPLSKLLRLATDGVVSFSSAPLRFAAGLGLLFSAVSFLCVPIIVALRLGGLYTVSGTASIHILVLLVGGIQLVFLGTLGEYIGRGYDETKGRPVYIVAPPPAVPLNDD